MVRSHPLLEISSFDFSRFYAPLRYSLTPLQRTILKEAEMDQDTQEM